MQGWEAREWWATWDKRKARGGRECGIQNGMLTPAALNMLTADVNSWCQIVPPVLLILCWWLPRGPPVDVGDRVCIAGCNVPWYLRQGVCDKE